MKKINLKGLDCTCYTEKLDNGLEVILLPYENKKNYFISYATRFGSDVSVFTPAHEEGEVKVPDGIAHFLEHKMFEQEDGIDPFTFFSESGTDANASTTFDSTQYICYGTKNFNENLKYLLRYVNSPFYTDENVEKEKGIIAEEIKMYADIPEFKLEMKLRENLYHVSPRRVDIAGSIESINKITKEDLYLCYNNFYSPNNMFLIVVGNFSKDEAMKDIHEVMDSIENRGWPTVKVEDEVDEVLKENEVIKFNVGVEKLAVGIKINYEKIEMEDILLDFYLTMFSTIKFGASSLFREKVRDQKLLSSFYTEWESTDKHKVFYIMASSSDTKLLLEEIKEELSNKEIDEETFNRMKKVWIANEVKMIDDVDATMNNLYDDMIRYGRVIPNKTELIRKMKYEDLCKLMKKIDLNNMSVVKMVAK